MGGMGFEGHQGMGGPAAGGMGGGAMMPNEMVTYPTWGTTVTVWWWLFLLVAQVMLRVKWMACDLCIWKRTAQTCSPSVF